MIIPQWPVADHIKAVTICRHDINKLENNDLPNKVLWLNQVHGIDSCNINLQPDYYTDCLIDSYKKHKLNMLSDHDRNKLIQADASYTTSKNIACAVKTADCLPILVTNKAGTWISAIHAGWRGLLAGIVSNNIANYQGDCSDLLVWIGPAICQRHFIVEKDVIELVKQNFNNILAFEKSDITNKWNVNLNMLAVDALKKLGIVNIFSCNYCTYCDQDLFYSYRRDGANTGRLITLIWNS
jgi:YfiH family protein